MVQSELPPRLLEPADYAWGSVGFRGVYQPTRFSPSSLNRLAVGSSIERSGRDGVESLVIDDLSGGFRAMSQYASFARNKAFTYINQGYQVQYPGVACLSYENVTNTSLIATNASGFRAANKRMHSAMYDGIWVGLLDTHMITSTSTTDQTLIIPSVADGVTETATAIAVVIANGTRYLVYAGSTTDDIQGTTAPLGAAGTVSWTKIVTLSDTPYINAIASMPHLGPGVNVVVGRPSTALGKGHFFFKQTDSLPATLSPVVLAATKDVPGSLGTTTMGSVDLAISGIDNSTASPITEGYLQSSGGAATNGAGFTSGSVYTGRAIFGNGAFSSASSFAKGRRVTGIALTVAHVEENVNDNIFPYEVLARVSGSNSQNLSDFVELGTSGTDAYGGSSITGGLNITTDDLDELSVVLSYWSTSISVAAGDLDSTDVDVVITYATDGAMHTPSLGGYTIGPMPAAPSTIVCVEPVTDDLTAITVDRRVVYYTYAWDSASERVVMGEPEYPAIGEPYVGVVAHYQGGVAVACGPNESTFNKVKLIVSPSDVRNLQFPGIHGTKAQTITRMVAQGNVLLVEVADTDGANAQLWIYQDQAWNAYGVQQSIESAIATEPVLWAETTLNTRLNYSYRFFPHSTTALRSATEFVAPNVNADPLIHNTDKVKTDGSPYLQTLLFDGGVPEARKTMLTLEMQTKYLDDDSAYGGVQVKIDTARDPTFASPVVTVNFGGATGETPGFTKYNIANTTTYVPGVNFKTFQVRFTANHSSGTGRSPNMLPLVIEYVGDFDDLEDVRIICRPEDQDRNIVQIAEQLKAAKRDSGVAQRLLGGHFNDPATFVDAVLRYQATPGNNLPIAQQVDYAELIFRITPGSVTSNGVTA